MTLAELIQKRLTTLPPEKQSEVLDFILFLQQRSESPTEGKRRSLKQHKAFGSWQGRKIDAVAYQQQLRSEWDRQ
ncbi:MAG: DUF2281 domain-containing protein [Chloroflexi bacterium]|nr:DUF2281 domain-containing protein [Chloroflexota bacterium]